MAREWERKWGVPRSRRTPAERARVTNAGYEPGGVGRLVDDLLNACTQTETMRMIAIQKGTKGLWAAYYTWKLKRDTLKKQLLRKAVMKNGSIT